MSGFLLPPSFFIKPINDFVNNPKTLRNRFQKELSKAKAQGVKGEILHLLGLISEHYSSQVHLSAPKLLKTYMDMLSSQTKKAEPESQVIASTFSGLTSFLTHFGGSVEEGALL